MTGMTAAQMVRDAHAHIQNLSPDEVAAELAQGALLVDVREDSECVQCAIPGALHVVRGMLEFYADPASPMHKQELVPTRRIIVQCASGGRSSLCAVTLQQLGYTNVANLDGGMKAWLAAGKPVTQG